MLEPLWRPSQERIANSLLSQFHFRLVREHPELADADYTALHTWSVDHDAEFWSAVWDQCGVIGERAGPVRRGAGMPGTEYFPQARLNFAENLLERGRDGDLALHYRGETGQDVRLTRGELKRQVALAAAHFRALGLKPGDRVAAMLPNRPEAVIAMLATTSLGATWSSCSPDFGEAGVLDRFGQIDPKIFIACAGYDYAGKYFDTRDKAARVRAQLDKVQAGYMWRSDPQLELPKGFACWSALSEGEATAPRYQRVGFNQPLYILYSSGTTGAPKCIVHGVGGTLLQHLKEHQLQADIHPGDPVFYFTTCGWMMWNWLVSALASEASLLLYDGSPFYPDPAVLFDFMDETHARFMGVSAKYIDALKAQDYCPRNTHRLEHLRSLASTGSPLAPESFEYVYRAIKPDLALQSISGGTDIVSCFVLGNPWQPVYPGEIQGKGLGMAVDVCDANGASVGIGEKGDLVCRRPFVSMPLGFWNDSGQRRYRAAYFDQFPGIWHHGDYAELTRHGGVIIHGRSDATLNPGGVRIGTAEIYRQVEQIPSVVESLAVGQTWEGDVRIVLFVILHSGVQLDENLCQLIRQRIRQGASPRHVPAKIVQVSDFPRTRSGKLAELAVRNVIQGEPVRNRNALANPESLDAFALIKQLQEA